MAEVAKLKQKIFDNTKNCLAARERFYAQLDGWKILAINSKPPRSSPDHVTGAETDAYNNTSKIYGGAQGVASLSHEFAHLIPENANVQTNYRGRGLLFDDPEKLPYERGKFGAYDFVEALEDECDDICRFSQGAREQLPEKYREFILNDMKRNDPWYCKLGYGNCASYDNVPLYIEDLPEGSPWKK